MCSLNPEENILRPQSGQQEGYGGIVSQVFYGLLPLPWLPCTLQMCFREVGLIYNSKGSERFLEANLQENKLIAELEPNSGKHRQFSKGTVPKQNGQIRSNDNSATGIQTGDNNIGISSNHDEMNNAPMSELS